MTYEHTWGQSLFLQWPGVFGLFGAKRMLRPVASVGFAVRGGSDAAAVLSKAASQSRKVRQPLVVDDHSIVHRRGVE